MTLTFRSANSLRIMSRRCELLGKGNMYGNTVSNANNRRRTRSLVNATWKRYYVPELNRFVRVRLSNRAVRTIDKLGGLIPACRRYKKSLSENLTKILKQAS